MEFVVGFVFNLLFSFLRPLKAIPKINFKFQGLPLVIRKKHKHI